jgi:hypothetical protein
MQPSYHSPENFDLGKNELPFTRKYIPYNSNQQQTREEDSNDVGYDHILNALNVRLHEGKLRALSHEEKRNNTRAATIAASPSKSPSFLSRGGAPRAPRAPSVPVRPIRNGLASKQYAPPPPTRRPNENLQNNYIYNGYFKDYAQQGGPSKPLPREEHIVRMKKRAEEQARQQARIREIKSQKMLFNNGNNHINTTNHDTTRMSKDVNIQKKVQDTPFRTISSLLESENMKKDASINASQETETDQNITITITTTSGSWNKMFQLKGVGV